MTQLFKYKHIALYALLLTLCIGGLYIYLSKIPYLKDYVDGFITHSIQSEKRDHHFLVDRETGQSDEVVILDVKNWPDFRNRLPKLIDSIQFYGPSALGIDLILAPKDSTADEELFQTLIRYDNIVLQYSNQDQQYPLGKAYDDFPNLCYTNFKALEAMPRYLTPYNIENGAFRTSFWAKLWELHSDTPSGKLKSRRRFINYNLKPLIHPIYGFTDLQDDDVVCFQDFANKIIILGNTSETDLFHVPIDDSEAHLHGRYLMTGVEIIGRATLTIGDNELDNSCFDQQRNLFGVLLFILLVIIFTFIHFAECCTVIRRYSNLIQFIGGVMLFGISRKLSPSMDEQWLLFSVGAVFLLMVPAVADIEKLLLKICSSFKKRKNHGNKNQSQSLT